MRAQRYLSDGGRHVVTVERWGTSGDKQDGVDLVGEFSGHIAAAWQCKHLEKLRPFEVRGAVEEVSYPHAAEFYLVFSRVASARARGEMKRYPGWSLWDRAQLTALLLELPRHLQRDILDQTWGEDIRRLFVGSTGDAFISIGRFAMLRRSPAAIMNDLGKFIGRDDEVAAMEAWSDRDRSGFPQVAVVSGPAGRGKTRLITDTLSKLQEQQPEVPIVCLSPGFRLTSESMGELRNGPTVILVDDAHTDPATLAPLLEFARSQRDVQVLLAVRPSARSAVLEQVILARFGPSETCTIDVGVLGSKQALELVESLCDGMNISFPLKRYFAEQARHSPFVAVIAMNLIRRRELVGPLAVDGGLRAQILSRYQEVLGADVEGYSTLTIQRVLATYAALGQVPADSRALMEQIASFCSLTLVELAKLVAALGDRGILVEQNGICRVTPDVLADHVLESVAAFQDLDTGFVSDLWDQFGAEHHHQLALALGELDWRLARQRGPRIMAQVWEAIRLRLQSSRYREVLEELRQLDQLAATQPVDLIEALEALRIRLDDDACAGIEPSDDGDDPYLAMFGLPPLGPDDVRLKMPPLYARAAANEPNLLETAMDALWALARRDARAADSNTDHPVRVVADHLGNLASLPDRSFPERIVTRVTEWLRDDGEPDGVTTPMFALSSLLAKEQLETVLSGTRQLSFETYTIDANSMRAVRDQIRMILLEQAISDHFARAGQALRLLREALAEPRGYFGQSVGRDFVLTWEVDDLATLETFSVIVNHTDVPVIRRQVRHHIGWSAEHATSLPVRHAALTLLAHLDRQATLEDDVADLVFPDNFGPIISKDRIVPSLETLTATAQDLPVRVPIEERMSLTAAFSTDVARRLSDLRDVPAMVGLLDGTVRDMKALQPNRSPTLWTLWRHLAENDGTELGAIVRHISELKPGPLDPELSSLLTWWLRTEPASAVAWIETAVTAGRRDIKLALADGFSGHQWYLLGRSLPDIWAIGALDAEPAVAEAFLAAAGPYLAEQPIAAVATLVEQGISEASAERALESASGYDGQRYGAGLIEQEATAVLRLISVAGYDSHIVQEIITGIALVHPQLILDHLRAEFASGGRPPTEIHELHTAYEAHPEVLALWIHRNLSNPDAHLVVSVASNDQLSDQIARALTSLVPALDGDQLKRLLSLLAGLDTWALRQPAFADTIAFRARQSCGFEEVRRAVVAAMRPSSWGTENGVSKELHAALAHAKRAAGRAIDEELTTEFERAAAGIQRQIDNDLHEYEDEEQGW